MGQKHKGVQDIFIKIFKGIQDILINSRDIGIQCFLDLVIFAIFLLGMWDIFSKYLKGYGILGSPTPSRASIVFSCVS